MPVRSTISVFDLQLERERADLDATIFTALTRAYLETHWRRVLPLPLTATEEVITPVWWSTAVPDLAIPRVVQRIPPARMFDDASRPLFHVLRFPDSLLCISAEAFAQAYGSYCARYGRTPTWEDDKWKLDLWTYLEVIARRSLPTPEFEALTDFAISFE